MAPLIVVVGETASGKSALAMELAEKFKGEIICADSRTVYKDMNIGTAKPSLADRARVPHHCLDLAKPNERFTVAEFKVTAESAIEDIATRGKVPIMVGGTGLYVDAVLYDYQFEGTDAARDPLNPRHLLRRKDVGSARKLRSNTLVIGLSVDREELRKRISERVEIMLAEGLETEVRELVEDYGWGAAAMNGIGYHEFRELLQGTQNLAETKDRIIQSTMQLAKKQRTWFKRNNSIQWLSDPSQAVEVLTTFLNKRQ